MNELNLKLQRAADHALAVDGAISGLLAELQELIGDLQREKRLHESGILIGVSASVRNSFYRKLGGQLQDMRNQPNERR